MNRLSPEDFKASMERAIEANRNLSAAAVKAMHKLMEQREEILEAFVAKYGFEPEEAVQIEFKTKENLSGWMVRKRTKDDPDSN